MWRRVSRVIQLRFSNSMLLRCLIYEMPHRDMSSPARTQIASVFNQKFYRLPSCLSAINKCIISVPSTKENLLPAVPRVLLSVAVRGWKSGAWANDQDIISWNAMVLGYASCELVGQARSLLAAMPDKDVVSWNSLISGYLQNGFFWESIEIFVMMGQMGMKPDRTTSAVVVKSCSGLEDYELGIQIHCHVVSVVLDFDVMAGSALVDMYAISVRAWMTPVKSPVKNSVSRSAVIAGYAQNGKPLNSLKALRKCSKWVLKSVSLRMPVYSVHVLDWDIWRLVSNFMGML